MQTARHAFCQQVAPHAPGAVGPLAGKEAGADLHPKLFVTPAALTARSCQPGIEPASRDTEGLAQPTRRPDPPVLRNETELHVDSFAIPSVPIIHIAARFYARRRKTIHERFLGCLARP